MRQPIEVLRDDFGTGDLSSLAVRPVTAEERQVWDQMMAEYHYLGFRQLVGESIRYVALLDRRWVALLGWSSAAFKSRSRDEWIGWTAEQRWQRLRFVVNNSRFLLLPGIRLKNLASKALAMNLKRLSGDWESRYGHPVLVAETFVEHSRFAGTCYRAAGWRALGQTRGFGRNAGRYYKHGVSRTVYVYPLHPQARELLSAEFLDPELSAEGALVNLNGLGIEGAGGLFEHLVAFADPRGRRGLRHKYVSALAIGACAWLAGAKSYLGIGRWAEGLTQRQLQRFGCRWDKRRHCYVPPSETTLRRVLASVDEKDFALAIQEWLKLQGRALPQGLVPPWAKARVNWVGER